MFQQYLSQIAKANDDYLQCRVLKTLYLKRAIRNPIVAELWF